LAAIPPLITMLTAAFIIHAADPWAKQEFALLYAVAYLTLIFTGAGRYSLDYLLMRRSERVQVPDL
jgi:putative oxidoreductase